MFQEGEKPQGVLYLMSGQVDLLFTARDGTMKALRVAHPGQILGLSSVITQNPYDCTAAARTPCRARFVSRDNVMRILQESPETWLSVLTLLSGDINAAYDDIRALAAR